MPVLLDMLQTPDSELAVAAADALRVLHMGARQAPVSPKVVERLEGLSKAYPGLIAQSVNELLKCLQDDQVRTAQPHAGVFDREHLARLSTDQQTQQLLGWGLKQSFERRQASAAGERALARAALIRV